VVSLARSTARALVDQWESALSVVQSWQKSGTAEFTADAGQSAIVINVRGEIDAVNANHLTEYVQRAFRQSKRVVLDLRDVDFIGTAGFSALHRINVVCSAAGRQWVLIPGRATHHLLRICDPDGTLPTTITLAEVVTGNEERAGSAIRGLLQLVPQSR
jgi:anti-anti-sigma factor